MAAVASCSLIWDLNRQVNERRKCSGDFCSWQPRVGLWTSLRGFMGRICTTFTIVLGIWNQRGTFIVWNHLWRLKSGALNVSISSLSLHGFCYEVAGVNKQFPRKKMGRMRKVFIQQLHGQKHTQRHRNEKLNNAFTAWATHFKTRINSSEVFFVFITKTGRMESF